MTTIKDNAHREAGVGVAGRQAATLNQNVQRKSTTDETILKSRSTAGEVQRKKILALLQQGPKTTIDFRDHGAMQPATRIWELRKAGHNIQTELLPLFDANGYLHSKCARYHLIKEAPQQFDLPGVSHE